MIEQSDEMNDDIWIDVSSNVETSKNADENAVDPQPEAEAQSPSGEDTRKQYPTRVRRPPDRL